VQESLWGLPLLQPDYSSQYETMQWQGQQQFSATNLSLPKAYSLSRGKNVIFYILYCLLLIRGEAIGQLVINSLKSESSGLVVFLWLFNFDT
jgi:hypothetical protein